MRSATTEEVSDPITHHIARSQDVLGGKPHIAGRRISVQNVATWHEQMGLSVEEIAAEYNLSLAAVYAALAYYHDHRGEITATMNQEQAMATDLYQRTPSRIPARRRS